MNVSALISFAEGEAYCPCCAGVRDCDPECTFKEDCEESDSAAQEKYERMLIARCALGDEVGE